MLVCISLGNYDLILLIRDTPVSTMNVVIATLLIPHNRISWNFLVSVDIIWVHTHKKFIIRWFLHELGIFEL